MRKINILHRTVPRDPQLQELFSELNDTRLALLQAHDRFNNTVESELVDACIYELGAVEARYNYLLRAIKERGGEAAAKLYTEGVVKWV
mgnify:CR=1 FL=1